MEAVGLLPRYAPEWTNHNASDPGITLIELLAYFTEMLIYRLNRVTRENKIQFLRLLGQHGFDENHIEADAVDELLRQTVLALRQPQRAVTAADYEYVTRDILSQLSDGEKNHRARSFMRMNLEMVDPAKEALDCPGHVSIVIASKGRLAVDEVAAVLEYVRKKLEPIRLLTTRLHVVSVRYLLLSLRVMLQPHPDMSFEKIRNEASEELQKYFYLWQGGGPSGEGWPFGRAVYLSEVYALLEKVPGTVSVQDVSVVSLHTTAGAADGQQEPVGIQFGISSTVGVDSRLGGETAADTERLVRDTNGRLTAVTLKPWEHVKVTADIISWRSSRNSSVTQSPYEGE